MALASTLSGGLDGAWWPRTGTMVRELPDLIDALQPSLGEIVDISINWSAGSATPVLSTMTPDMAARLRPNGCSHRLMSIVGRTAGTRLLVVPAITPAPLAQMVLRQAADRHVPEVECGTPIYEAAGRVVCAARAASAAWAG